MYRTRSFIFNLNLAIPKSSFAYILTHGRHARPGSSVRNLGKLLLCCQPLFDKVRASRALLAAIFDNSS